MNTLLKTSLLILLVANFASAQDPVPVLSAHWQRTVQKADKPDVTPTSPSVPVIPENKYFQRKAREARTDNPLDPTEGTIEGRSRAMDKIAQESRTAQPDDTTGFVYTAEIRNDTGKAIDVIFWEYRFTEIAKPANIVRRQFLCAGKIKDGEKRELSAFSLLGPSDAIDVESLAKSKDKLFDEKITINRIEFSDGAILQRHTWKFDEVKAGVKRATEKPWGTETCRPL